MNTLDRLDTLIQKGEELYPKGGEFPDGYNKELQDDYHSWWAACIALIEEMGVTARHLRGELKSDTRGQLFYASSASRVRHRAYSERSKPPAELLNETSHCEKRPWRRAMGYSFGESCTIQGGEAL